MPKSDERFGRVFWRFVVLNLLDCDMIVVVWQRRIFLLSMVGRELDERSVDIIELFGWI